MRARLVQVPLVLLLAASGCGAQDVTEGTLTEGDLGTPIVQGVDAAVPPGCYPFDLPAASVLRASAKKVLHDEAAWPGADARGNVSLLVDALGDVGGPQAVEALRSALDEHALPLHVENEASSIRTLYSMATTRKKYCSFADCGGSSAPSGGNCVRGGQDCGGDKVSGDPRTLYYCNGPGTPTVIARCAAGCQVMSGSDDVCHGAGGCEVGGHYCGGDKVTGDPRMLYRCDGGSRGTPVQDCASGCAVHPGRDDSCR